LKLKITFIIDKDYKILLTRKGEQDFMKNDEIILDSKKVLKKSHGGNNIQKVLFKRKYKKS
jgi:hypothetical protein